MESTMMALYHVMRNKKTVIIPVTEQPFSDARFQELVQLIDPLRESDSYGIDVLLDVLQFCCQSI